MHGDWPARTGGSMERLALILAAVLVAAPSVVGAQDSYRDVECVSGRTGFDTKMKGTLVIDDSMIALRDKSSEAVLISIPISTVKQVSASNAVNGGSVGRKLLLGVFASHNEELVTISAENTTDAEAIVLKVKSNTSAGISARIQCRLE
jgi:hypothetical protein